MYVANGAGLLPVIFLVMHGNAQQGRERKPESA
jgi:hypothetical protein